MLEREGKKGARTRRVTGREGFEIVYVESHFSLAARATLTSKPKTCWISTWMEWAREAKVVSDPGDIFAMSKPTARKLLSGLEIEGTLTKYLQERYPKYIDADGQAMKFTLAIDLGLIET